MCSFNRSIRPPAHLTFDIDAFDDPAHGEQQLIMFHGYYEQFQYLPIVITCAENDMVLLVGLRHGTCAATLGVDNDLRYLMGRLRAVWPDVHIHVRGDSGLGVPLMYDVCQELRLSYTFGIGMNSRLRELSDDLMNQALEEYEKTGQPQRLFLLVDYQAGSWSAPQPVVIKVEAHAQGTNRRAVVTNRPGWESSRRRSTTSTRARREREPEQGTQDRAACRPAQRPPVPGKLLPALPAHRRDEPAGAAAACRRRRRRSAPNWDCRRVAGRGARRTGRRRFFNERRDRDPLGEGFACTWRTRLIKVAAEVLMRARRVIVRLSGSWPHLDQFLTVSRIVSDPVPVLSSG